MPRISEIRPTREAAERQPEHGADDPEDQRLDEHRAHRHAREAPSVRSIPSSRMRWSTVMLKLFRIRKPPTNSATPEKK